MHSANGEVRDEVFFYMHVNIETVSSSWLRTGCVFYMQTQCDVDFVAAVFTFTYTHTLMTRLHYDTKICTGDYFKMMF